MCHTNLINDKERFKVEDLCNIHSNEEDPNQIEYPTCEDELYDG